MEYTKNKYYIRLNENSRIVKWFSEVFEKPLDGDILIGEGYGVQFVVGKEVLSEELQEYANVENGLPLTNERGILQLKFENGVISKVSDVELKVEIARTLELMVANQPTEIEMLREETDVLKEKVAELEAKTRELEEQNANIMIEFGILKENYN